MSNSKIKRSDILKLLKNAKLMAEIVGSVADRPDQMMDLDKANRVYLEEESDKTLNLINRLENLLNV